MGNREVKYTLGAGLFTADQSLEDLNIDVVYLDKVQFMYESLYELLLIQFVHFNF